jgi:hypothetical protein
MSQDPPGGAITPSQALTFPCQFPIKAIGGNTPGFETLVVGIVGKHAGDPPKEAIRRRLSGGGKYISITITITARSREQLNAIYQELSAQEQVKMVL